MKNARFWSYINGAFVKITLKPDQKMTWHMWEPTDEGFTAEIVTWENDTYLNAVVRDVQTNGSDCDGQHGYYQTDVCSINKLSSRSVSFDDDETFRPKFVPEWQKQSSEVYDQFAQAAGY